MITETELLAIIARIAAATGLKEKTLSSRIFNDGKKINQMRNGSSITLRRAERALAYIAEHWPEHLSHKEAAE